MAKWRLPVFLASVSKTQSLGPLDTLKGGGMLGGGRWTEVRAKEGKDMWEQVYDRQMDIRGFC